MTCLRTDEFVKEPIRIKNKISQEVTSNTIAEIKALKYCLSMSCQVFSKYNCEFILSVIINKYEEINF